MTNAPSRPLLSALTSSRAVEALFSNEAELAALLQVEAALADAEAKAGLITADAAMRIGEACRGFQPDWESLAEGLAKDGVIVPELVRQLRDQTEEPHRKLVHLGATSQDIIDTALMLRLKQAAAILAEHFDALAGVFPRLAERYGATPLMAHTRMQQALAFTAADKLETWSAPLRRQAQTLAELAPHLFALQLGGAVGTRAAFEGKGNAIAAEMAKTLKLSDAPCWHSQRDRIAEFGSWLSLTSGLLGKIGKDIALMAQTELAEVSLEGGGGSSAMPHKSNPVQAEMLVTLARFNAGLLGTLHQALVHENERSGAAWTLEWMVLPQMVVATAAGLEKAHALLAGLHFRPSKVLG
ncbi:3-carboxy-cis,cis-muconate cycloisomerase [Mesorhizobium sp. Root554]|uniref:3-carboxy-cis,cis-muconate cycloisomerase n=1 Tax=unclassified Mesorhizobium TaxID=325217 RepID=UPI0006F592DE|nr:MULTISPECIES: 3-carboxy-cis,cis-muconate cycloisomerase [unclassified Mesorhizobium]KQZ14136.1 3-carboxy-cis,cis-muconate cycloisomerase [Mesorhizobium sp. Root1471]KQZ36648.1 3-carboxy-cis,cis-muconate cycloisomerase [Mesorhizobium sp. Root554]